MQDEKMRSEHANYVQVIDDGVAPYTYVMKNNSKGKFIPSKERMKYPKYITDVVKCLKDNYDLMKYTEYGILFQLYPNSVHELLKRNFRPVKFLWNKYEVRIDGLAKQYPYTENLFLNAFLASFMAHSHAMEKKISTMIDESGFDPVLPGDAFEEDIANNAMQLREYAEKIKVDNIVSQKK